MTSYKTLCAEQRALARVVDFQVSTSAYHLPPLLYVYDSLVAAVRASGEPPAHVVELFLANFSAAIAASRECSA